MALACWRPQSWRVVQSLACHHCTLRCRRQGPPREPFPTPIRVADIAPPRLRRARPTVTVAVRDARWSFFGTVKRGCPGCRQRDAVRRRRAPSPSVELAALARPAS
jgi:hypothetical protein